MGDTKIGVNALSSLTVVTMLHTRSLDHLRWQLWSLDKQTVNVDSIIVATGNNEQAVKRVCDAYPCRILFRPQHTLRRAWALNIGIQQAQTEYVACVDVDFVFSPNFCEVALNKLQEYGLVMCQPMSLSKSFPVFRLLAQWERWLPRNMPAENGVPWPGAFQAAHRDWWHKVHGYDERYMLSGMDDDLQFRAHMDGLKKYWIPFDMAQALHQWHEVSSERYSDASDLMLIGEVGRQIMVNRRRGWGEL